MAKKISIIYHKHTQIPLFNDILYRIVSGYGAVEDLQTNIFLNGIIIIRL